MVALLWVLGAAVPPVGSSTVTGAEQVRIVGRRLDGPSRMRPWASFRLGEKEVRNGRATLSLGESLSRVPGVFVTSRRNFAQDTRLSIRGFGARSAFGIRGIRVFLDGIPLTLPDGQTQLDTLDLAHVGRIDLLRGAAGSIYGNAAGGVLWIESPRPPPVPQVRAWTLAAPRGTWKLATTGQGRLGPAELSVFASRVTTDGYRERSAAEQWIVQAKILIRLSRSLRWTQVVHFVEAPKAEDPGGLTPSDFRSNPRQAAAPNLEFRTGEAVTQLQAGSLLDAKLALDHRLQASVHGGLRDFRNALPFRTVSFVRTFFGGRLDYRWSEPSWGHTLSAGLEGQFQRDRRENQGNDGGVPDGNLSLLQDESVDNLGVHLRERIEPWNVLGLFAGGRYDRIRFDVDDQLQSADGSRIFDQVTASGGLLLNDLGPFEAFASFARSFETPTTTELVNSAPGGTGLSRDLAPQRSNSWELGARWRDQRLFVELTGFFIDLEDELVPNEDVTGRVVFSNAGRSERIGTELFLRYRPLPHLEMVVSHSWLRARFTAGERDGRTVPGLPEHRLFARLGWDDGRLFGAAELEWVSARFADDENRIQAPDHALAELRLGARFEVTRRWKGELSIGLENVFDVRWVDNIRVNGFGDRVFEPGLPFGGFGIFSVRHTPSPHGRSPSISRADLAAAPRRSGRPGPWGRSEVPHPAARTEARRDDPRVWTRTPTRHGPGRPAP